MKPSPHRLLVYHHALMLTVETGGTVQVSTKAKAPSPVLLEDPLHQRISSIMTLNPETGQFEVPPPRWFNKDTGNYEDVKPMYLIDSNPLTDGIAPSRIAREDDAFRRFIEDKEEKRRRRLEREFFKSKEQPVAPKPKAASPKTETKAPEIMAISKRAAGRITGPASKTPPKAPPQVPEISAPPPINEDEIVNAWKNTPALRAPPKSKKSAEEIARKTLQQKSTPGRWTFAAMRGSYRPPKTIESESSSGGGWNSEVRLENSAWWEQKPAPSQWKSKSSLREEQGRLAINPMTGKLEDIAPASRNTEGASGDLLMEDRPKKKLTLEDFIDLM